MAFYIHSFTKTSTKLSTQGQIVNILGIVSHGISVMPVQLYHCSTKQATARTSDRGVWLCSNKTLFTESWGRLDLHGLLCQHLWYMRGKQKSNNSFVINETMSLCAWLGLELLRWFCTPIWCLTQCDWNIWELTELTLLCTGPRRSKMEAIILKNLKHGNCKMVGWVHW